MKLETIGKKLITAPIKNKIIQGEANVDIFEISLPKIYGNMDMSLFSFKMRALSEKNTMAEQVLAKSVTEDKVNLIWVISSDFTAVDGTISLELIGTDTDGSDVIKITADDIYVKPSVTENYNPPDGLLEQVIAQIQTAADAYLKLADSLVIEYDIQTDKVGFKHKNETQYTYTQSLIGPKGDQGVQGEKGVDGLTPTIINNLTSTAVDKALSAFQGKTLNDKVTNIGGTNLLKNSAWVADTAGWTISNTTYVTRDKTVTLNGCNTIKISAAGAAADIYPTIRQNISAKKGDMFVLTAWYYVADKTTFDYKFVFGTQEINSAGTKVVSAETTILPADIIQGVWTKITRTYTITNADTAYVQAIFFTQRNGTIWLSQPKLERGYAATDWSANPSDNYLMQSVPMPAADNILDIGTSALRFQDIYASNGVIQTSDANEKTDITTLDTVKSIEFLTALNPVSFRFNDGTRKHYGLISQEVAQAMTDCGISDMDFAGYIKSPIYETSTNENGDETQTITGYRHMLRYDEFIALLISIVQNQEQRIKILENNV